MKYTNTLGLLGRGISYSLSPWIHTAAAHALGLPYRYQLFDVEPAVLEAFLQEFWAEGGLGLNITQPYKRVVAELVQSSDPAINTLYRNPHHVAWQSLSTDGEGFLAALDRVGGVSAFSHWVFLGNGGAVSGILDATRQLATGPQVSVLRRDPKKDGELKGVYPGVRFLPFSPTALQEILALGPCLLVQASTASVEAWGPFLPILAEFSGCCMDLAYGARCSSLFLALRDQRHPCEDGLAMLVEQARFAQKIWWDLAPSREALLAAMIEMAPQYGVQWNEYKTDIQRLQANPMPIVL